MKIFSWAVVFVIIVFPLFFKNDLRVMEQERTQEAMVMYNGAFQAAVQDAAFALQMNESQNQESNYGSLKKVRANKELAVEAFYETLFHNTGIADDATAQGVLKAYIPLLAIIDYDGIWVYTNESFRNERGELENRQVWNSKKHTHIWMSKAIALLSRWTTISMPIILTINSGLRARERKSLLKWITISHW